MNTLTVRSAAAGDAALLRDLARRCYPLDVHTPYTYWVVGRFFGRGCFLLEHAGEAVGYIMTVDTPECLFVWQIGLLEPWRAQGHSQILIGAAAEYAAQLGKEIQLSIAPENKASYGAFAAYCRDHGMTLEPCGEISLTDLNDKDFWEYEVHYRMK